jgi:hypothetical protein
LQISFLCLNDVPEETLDFFSLLDGELSLSWKMLSIIINQSIWCCLCRGDIISSIECVRMRLLPPWATVRGDHHADWVSIGVICVIKTLKKTDACSFWAKWPSLCMPGSAEL